MQQAKISLQIFYVVARNHVFTSTLVLLGWMWCICEWKGCCCCFFSLYILEWKMNNAEITWIHEIRLNETNWWKMLVPITFWIERKMLKKNNLYGLSYSLSFFSSFFFIFHWDNDNSKKQTIIIFLTFDNAQIKEGDVPTVFRTRPRVVSFLRRLLYIVRKRPVHVKRRRGCSRFSSATY